MDFDLANELKVYGFPQKGRGWHLPDWPSTSKTKPHLAQALAYRPTLPELVQACGEEFAFVECDTEGDAPWSAYDTDGFRENGSTPEEAVAALWLANLPFPA